MAAYIGVRVDRHSRRRSLAISLGVALNFVGLVLLGGGGPGAFAGMFVWPLLYLLVATLAHMFKRAWVGDHGIPEDEAKAVTEYFAKGKLAVPGQEPTTKPPARRRKT